MYAIPKPVSRATADSTSTFFTEFPPELRNMVYKLLLKRNTPVLLHNTMVYHTMLPDPTDGAHVMESYYERMEYEIDNADEFRHGFEGTTSLLLTCRQIYHEATGVLYGKNSFVISRVNNQHDYDEFYELHQRDQRSYFQTAYAGAWLTGLGSQVHCLQRVVIDVDTMCPNNCYHMISRCGYDVLPLLRLLWESPRLFKVMSFGHSGRTLNVHGPSEVSDLDPRIPVVHLAKTFNNLLVTLVAKDALSIKRYSKFAQLLSRINICPRDQNIHVHFKPSELEAEQQDRTLSFKISDDGKTITKSSRRPLSLVTLPNHIKVRIYEFASYNPDGLVFDISAQKLQGINMGMFQVNRTLRRYYNRVVAKVNAVTIKIISTNTVTDFDQFDLLQKFDEEFLINKIFRYSSEGRIAKEIRPPTILLKIESPTTSTLSDVRINVKGLLGILYYPHIHNEAILRIALECPWGTRSRTETAEVPIKPLRTKLFLLISDLIIQSGTNTDTLRPAADIYIDGHGAPLDATVATVSIQRQHFSAMFNHTGLNNVEIRARGYQKAGSLAEFSNRLAQIDKGKSALLIHQWTALRGSAFPDWRYQAGRQGKEWHEWQRQKMRLLELERP
ncbi:hypothetical protein G6011_01922 [Alternaria panax]|uniref:DUF7730 domain-containing protein n=1 Tax=Alternaria panax TaxID=48097 RepID=A0AAD4FI47_9PLEO|nr:hypothetical protein G6011_01922 [Alternaria panax]